MREFGFQKFLPDKNLALNFITGRITLNAISLNLVSVYNILLVTLSPNWVAQFRSHLAKTWGLIASEINSLTLISQGMGQLAHSKSKTS